MSGKAPVMVWIHGGANRAGSGGDLIGSSYTSQGVVGVDIQYRLGALGYLSHPGLSSEQGDHSGNYGVMDQIAALQWIKANISRFGGDPDNVTIFGSSAGSLGVSLLLAAPDAQGLFHKAVMQSGNFFWSGNNPYGYRSLADAEKLGTKFAEMADANSVDELRAVSAVAIVELQQQLDEPESGGMGLAWARVTIDGKTIPDAPEILIKRNGPKPVILGTNKAEFGAAVDESFDWAAFAQFHFGERGPEALEAYRDENPDLRRGDLAMRLSSDAIFHCPTDTLADYLADHGWPVWRYEFDIGSNGGLTFHSDELPYVHTRRQTGGDVYMQDYWVALAATGDPNGITEKGRSRPDWERWRPDRPRQIRFTEADTEMEPGKPRGRFCDLRSSK
jgi:para-nitrobenzyl esterase